MKIEEFLPDSHRKTADLAVQFVIEHPKFIQTLISEIEKQKSVLAMRISRVIALCHERKSELIITHIEDLLNILFSTNNKAVIRNILYIFQTAWDKTKEDDLGQLLDFCFKHLGNPSSEPALRVYSMNIIFASTSIYPELKNELKHMIELHYEESSAGFKARGWHILKKLNK